MTRINTITILDSKLFKKTIDYNIYRRFYIKKTYNE